jgi:hypothetical protein
MTIAETIHVENENLLLTFCNVWCRVVEQYVGIVLVMLRLCLLLLLFPVLLLVQLLAVVQCLVLVLCLLLFLLLLLVLLYVAALIYLLIVLHPSGTHCGSSAETSIILGADRLASRQ